MKFATLAPLLSVGIFLAAIGCKGGDEKAAETTPPVSFSMVQGVLSSKCVSCHGGERPAGGVGLTNFADVMKGNRGGPIVKAGDAANSELVQVMRATPGHKKMPPSGPAVEEEKIKLVEGWIQAGAKETP